MSGRPRAIARRWPLRALLLLGLLLPGVIAPAAIGYPAASSSAGSLNRTQSSASGGGEAGGDRSPSGPALTDEPPSSDEEAGVEAGEGGSAQAEADPLVSNGLGSPLCRGTAGVGVLSAGARRDCETSDFVAAAAPTNDFGIDVHIDTGLLGLSSSGLLAAVQDLCVTPVWMAIVWVVHALLVMLEWCFTIDLLDSGSVQSGLAHGLRQMQSAFTLPWMASVLAVASVLAAYNGLVRRRVGETLAGATLMLAMMAGGFWVMLDPTGTVGALGTWANQASLGTLAATGGRSPSTAPSTLSGGMHAVFSAAIEAPWCYLEFGNVGWCRDRSRLDPRLRSAALAIATEEAGEADCATTRGSSESCSRRSGGEAKALENSAALLRAARTNGAIFLALPANGAARNSINDESSLLRAICQSANATSCRGSAASEAEFRTNRGTWPRVGGLLLIVAGVLGMVLLLGFITIRLLTAALFSLLYLLLAPVAVLAPALGENGRAVFRKWLTQLLGAVISKLLFSFLLGAVLVVLDILADLQSLGWWTQWLLMSAFWWAAFVRRHQTLQIAGGAPSPGEHARRTLLRRLNDVVEPRRRLRDRAHDRKQRREARSQDAAAARRRAHTVPELLAAVAGTAQREQQRARSPSTSERAPTPGYATLADGTAGDAQVRRMLDVERGEARAQLAGEGEIEGRLSASGARLARVRAQHAAARAAGDRRRAVSLASRERRLQDAIDRERSEIAAARRLAGRPAAGDQPASGAAGGARDGAARADTGAERFAASADSRARFLDAQAALPSALEAHRSRTRERRDYAALAGLAGYGPRAFAQLAERERREARITIDRELALRRDSRLSFSARRGGVAGQGSTASRPRARRGDQSSLERAHRTPPRGAPAVRPGRATASESSVMQDAREVEAGRKRQLGYDRP